MLALASPLKRPHHSSPATASCAGYAVSVYATIFGPATSLLLSSPIYARIECIASTGLCVVVSLLNSDGLVDVFLPPDVRWSVNHPSAASFDGSGTIPSDEMSADGSVRIGLDSVIITLGLLLTAVGKLVLFYWAVWPAFTSRDYRRHLDEVCAPGSMATYRVTSRHTSCLLLFTCYLSVPLPSSLLHRRARLSPPPICSRSLARCSHRRLVCTSCGSRHAGR